MLKCKLYSITRWQPLRLAAASSATAFGAALAIVLGIGIPGFLLSGFISVNAFIFALLATLLLDFISRWMRVSTSGIILFGIALVFTFNAVVSIMQFIANEDTLQGLVFWTMGSLNPGIVG